MKILLKKPYPQPELGKVIPAGVIIEAPAGLSERLLRTGAGEPVSDKKAQGKPVATAEKRARKKVKAHA